MTGTGTGAGTGTVVVDPLAGNPWYHGADTETVGYIQNRGLTNKTAAEAALAAIKSHREAEAHIGVPADQILRLPKDATDEAGWNNVWRRLGAPAEAKDYDLSTLKGADGNPVSEGYTNFVRSLASKLHLPKDAATSLANDVLKFNNDTAVAAATERSAALQVEQTTLKANWGANFEANMLVARNAAKALGVEPAAVQALENQVGYAKVMEMFRAVGSKIGEDKFISGGGGGNQVMTREQAVARKGELMRDQDWTKSYLAGDAAKVREMTALNTLIVAGQAA